jgi:hypothetical protein
MARMSAFDILNAVHRRAVGAPEVGCGRNHLGRV